MNCNTGQMVTVDDGETVYYHKIYNINDILLSDLCGSITQLEPECADEYGTEEWCFLDNEIICDFVPEICGSVAQLIEVPASNEISLGKILLLEVQECSCMITANEAIKKKV